MGRHDRRPMAVVGTDSATSSDARRLIFSMRHGDSGSPRSSGCRCRTLRAGARARQSADRHEHREPGGRAARSPAGARRTAPTWWTSPVSGSVITLETGQAHDDGARSRCSTIAHLRQPLAEIRPERDARRRQRPRRVDEDRAPQPGLGDELLDVGRARRRQRGAANHSASRCRCWRFPKPCCWRRRAASPRDRRRRADPQRDRVADGAVPRADGPRHAGRGLVRRQHDAEGHDARARDGPAAGGAAADDRGRQRVPDRRPRHRASTKKDFAVLFQVLAKLSGVTA